MNNIELADYYIKNRDEFIMEFGHDKLLIGLKNHIATINKENTKIIGIDVGCCIGDYIENLEIICNEPNSDILCFEPNPINIVQIENKIVDKNNITLFKCCVSNEITNAALYNHNANSNENKAGNGLAGLRSGAEKICDIYVTTLDNIIDERYAGQDIIIKFLKVDTEGNDSNVIKGLQKYLSKTCYIIFECSDCLDDHRGPGIKYPMKDIVDFLSLNGFDIYRIGTKKLIKVNDEYWNDIYEEVKFWSNCFAIKKGDDLINKLIDNNFNYLY